MNMTTSLKRRLLGGVTMTVRMWRLANGNPTRFQRFMRKPLLLKSKRTIVA